MLTLICALVCTFRLGAWCGLVLVAWAGGNWRRGYLFGLLFILPGFVVNVYLAVTRTAGM